MEKLKIIGLCPVCGQGNIVEKEETYICNKPCGFYIHKEIKNTPITPSIVRKIITQGHSDIMQFSNVEGNKFFARAILQDKEVVVQFDNKYLKGRCPICGGRIQVTENGYNCENGLIRNETEDKCNFHINKTLGNRPMTEEEVERFLSGEKDIFDGFRATSGNEFSAFLEVSEVGYVRTSSRISTCPKCGGTILVGTKAFNCSNYKTEGCHMKLPRKVSGHKLTYDDVIQLCERDDHTTDPIEIKLANGKTVRRSLTLNSDYETITI